MPIDIDTSEAPALLRLRVRDPFPSADEIAALRQRLITSGSLNASSVSLIDVREVTGLIADAAFLDSVRGLMTAGGWPHRRAVLMNPGKHLRYMQLFQAMAPASLAIAGFLDEHQALEWLLNPEGRAGFTS